MVEHHRIFRNAELWSGRIADHIDVDFLGAREDKQFFLPEWRDAERDFSKTHHQWANLPEFSEEYFEWIDLLAAVRARDDDAVPAVAAVVADFVAKLLAVLVEEPDHPAPKPTTRGGPFPRALFTCEAQVSTS